MPRRAGAFVGPWARPVPRNCSRPASTPPSPPGPSIFKQTFVKQGKSLRRRAGGYAHAKQFGLKVSVAVTHKQALVVGARSLTGNPYDGHTLAEQLEQVKSLSEDSGASPKQAVVAPGLRSVDAAKPGIKSFIGADSGA